MTKKMKNNKKEKKKMRNLRQENQQESEKKRSWSIGSHTHTHTHYIPYLLLIDVYAMRIQTPLAYSKHLFHFNRVSIVCFGKATDWITMMSFVLLSCSHLCVCVRVCGPSGPSKGNISCATFSYLLKEEEKKNTKLETLKHIYWWKAHFTIYPTCICSFSLKERKKTSFGL